MQFGGLCEDAVHVKQTGLDGRRETEPADQGLLFSGPRSFAALVCSRYSDPPAVPSDLRTSASMSSAEGGAELGWAGRDRDWGSGATAGGHRRLPSTPHVSPEPDRGSKRGRGGGAESSEPPGVSEPFSPPSPVLDWVEFSSDGPLLTLAARTNSPPSLGLENLEGFDPLTASLMNFFQMVAGKEPPVTALPRTFCIQGMVPSGKGA